MMVRTEWAQFCCVKPGGTAREIQTLVPAKIMTGTGVFLMVLSQFRKGIDGKTLCNHPPRERAQAKLDWAEATTKARSSIG